MKESSKTLRQTPTRSFFFILLLIPFVLLAASAANGQTAISLANLKPQSVRSRFPGRNVNPQPLSWLTLSDGNSYRVVRFVADSEIVYAVPTGQSSFSGVIAYADINNRTHAPDLASPNRLRIRLVVDEKTVLDAVMDDQTPPQKFAIPLVGARRITIVSDEDYSWTSFILAGADFSPRPVDAVTSAFLPAPASGYIDVTPLARQGMFHVFRPGETVPVSVYVAGQQSHADVDIRLTPEQAPSHAFAITLSVSLHQSDVGRSEGRISWTLPSWRGPASLQLEERVNGRLVFERHFRVALAPQVDLSTITNSTFGLHTSSDGFLRAQDDFAALWGAKWDRVFIRWELVESAQGHYDFSLPDAIVNSLLNQNMRVLGVLGEKSPAWAGAPSTAYDAAWKRFVDETTRHYRDKIDHWDIFNEVDVKYEANVARSEPNFDLNLLRAGINSVHQNPKSTAVCCSPGSTPWLPYYKRLFDAGLAPSIDVLSIHPYELGPPEEKDGPFNYEERLTALSKLAQAYGHHKPIWSTESNWILGTRGDPDVSAPDIDEHTQAEYVVRVNLLSLSRSTPYFLHMPFYHLHRKRIHLDTLAAYANMSSLLLGVTASERLIDSLQQTTYGFTWTTSNSRVTALWTLYGTATLTVSGLQDHPRILDFYGNPLDLDPTSLTISTAPTYIISEPTSRPTVKVLKASPFPDWHPVPPLGSWSLTPGSIRSNVSGGIEITSQPAKYTYQLVSPTVMVNTNTCYLVRSQINLKRGSVMLFAVDKVTGNRIGDIAYIAYVPDNLPHEVQLRFLTGSVSNIRFVLADANLEPGVSQFQILKEVELCTCP
jgi:hypothetical protein